MNSRQTAAGIVGQWIDTGDFPDRLLGTGPDRAFVMEVVYGVVRQRRALEWMVGRYSSREPDREVWPYLLVGAYQLLMMDNVADHAALNETVEAVKTGPVKYSAGFINAILREIQRNRDGLRKELAAQPLGTRESHPDVLVDRWTQTLGKDKTEQLCRWNNSRPDVIIHVDRRKTECQNLATAMEAQGIIAVPHPFAPDEFLAIPHGRRIPDLPGYNEGLFSVQDPSTIVPVRLLDPRPGQAVLDACSAPGGKTILVAERMEGKGDLIAVDLYADRIRILAENISRMGLENVKIVQASAIHRDEIRQAGGDRMFDRILLDVPCTNTGVLRRRPDARWRFSMERLQEITEIQRLILNSTASFLKPQGILVYSTCSIEPEECDRQIRSWLAGNAGFELVESVNLFPPETGTDGIYAAAIRKK
ncbi:MAG: 16S rRNA (cytosine(967)-C(5))-methyltransferase RsmB [Spirochaetales bacterium]|nr:MAG: 16S rRNA (cytosine(967)-C(5))-methyltransferase RsmB [Spirochaetales bacterium]